MQTQCTPCGKVLSNPTAAAKHVLRHPLVARKGRTAEWGKGAYRDGRSWGDYSQSTPRSTLNQGAKTGGDSEVRASATAAPSARPTPRLTRTQAQERNRLLEIAWPHRTVPTICAWCGRNVTKDKASPHHLTPRDKGGTDEPRNLALVHLGECHDNLEEWTREAGRAPSGDEWGHLDQLWGNVISEGVGTRGESHPPVKPVSPLTVDDVPRYLRFLTETNRRYQEQVAANPEWGMWVFHAALEAAS